MLTRTQNRFSSRAIYRYKQPHALHFASTRYSFWVATFALFAFVVGNMIGQHGWYAFWHSVMGRMDDSAIVFTGTVTPIDRVPDYSRWSQYGGNPVDHTFRMVPEHVLIPLPWYDGVAPRYAGDTTYVPFSSVYSVGHLGDYITGADGQGSHVGIDIRSPIGTPVRSIANGVVDMVRHLSTGYGKHVVIRHPNVPNPDNPRTLTTLYSVYAHLDSIVVTEGAYIQKGELLGTVGQTGLASGPHLHFQIDKDSAPFHPYWPFTSAEASAARMTFTQAVNAGLGQELGRLYTVNPMEFVQAHLTYTPGQMPDVSAPVVTHRNDPADLRFMTPAERALARRTQRDSGQPAPVTQPGTVTHPLVPSVPAPQPPPTHTAPPPSPAPVSPAPAPVQPAPPPVQSSPVAVSTPAPVSTATPVASLGLRHNGTYNRSWEKVFVTAYDAQGNVAVRPTFSGTIYLRVAFGEGEIRPDTLTPADFVNGVATVNVLPRGSKRSFILETKGPFEVMSEPMRSLR